MSYCQKCGAYIPDGETRCLACGWSPEDAAQSQSAPGPEREPRREESGARAYSYGAGEEARSYSYGPSAEEEERAREEARRAKRRAYANEYRADARENRSLGYLCYLGPLLLIPLLTKPNSAFLRFHCNQGIALALFCVLVSICDWLPVFGGLAGAVGTVCAIVWLCKGLSNVSKGRRKPLPVIGGLKFLK